MIVLANARVVAPAGIVDPGWIGIEGARIVDVGSGDPPRGGGGTDGTDLGGATVVPGFVDLHVHGGGGHDSAADRGSAEGAVAFHRSHGTTRTLVSLMADEVSAMCEQSAWLAGLVERGPTPEGHVVGIHQEGPFLAAARRGAQPLEVLRAPDPASVRALLDAGRGHVSMVTMAPELPGAEAAADAYAAAGAIVALGHTDATYEDALAAFRAAPRNATHLFNGMPPLHHRAPGPALAAIEAAAGCEVIADGVHLHPAILRLVARLIGDRLVLVTDAMAAAGLGDGAYRLGTQDVAVRAGVARLRDDEGSLAGSTLTMDAGVRTLVAAGIPLEAAVSAAATTPARLLGLGARCGALAPGLDADLVVLDAGLRVSRVMAQGRWCV
jgi:N-acetylglucosamine-6-phosphate deacetylase